MAAAYEWIQWLLGAVLIASALGIILFRQPVHACLSFLLALLSLAALYLQLFAQFIAVIQILVYGGAILVIFMFVIILFQDAHAQIDLHKANCFSFFLFCAGAAFIAGLATLGARLKQLPASAAMLPADYGAVHSLGWKLYINFFFPFEALTLLFLIALIGSVYIAKRLPKV